LHSAIWNLQSRGFVSDIVARLTSALGNRYTVERELGSGGMATVYLAVDVKHGRKVAVKVLRPELTSALGAERFEREIEMTAHFSHPHILPLLESGEAQGLLYYVMPYVDGGSLRDRMDRERQLPIDAAVQIACEVADALDSAHRRGIVHRDIKPENILIEEGHAVVADFGVARALSAADEDRLTGSGIAVGTPAYLSPEQAAGGTEVDKRSDIYSLGCVVYEMLAGEPPITGATVESILRKHISSEPSSISVVRPTVPDALARTVHRALAKAPADRFATAGELAIALHAALARPPSDEHKRRRRLWWASAAAIPALIFASLWLRGPFERSGSPDSVAVLPCESATDDSTTTYFSEAITDDIITELSRLGSLRVINVTSALQYRDTDLSLEQIAGELNVARLVRCTARESDGRVSIAAQVIEPRSGTVVWADRFDRPMENVLGISSEVAVQLAAEMNAAISDAERQLMDTPRRVHPEAYRAYQQGKQLFRRNTVTDWERAIDYYLRAVAYDSSYAEAYSGLAEVHALLPTMDLTRSGTFADWLRWNDESMVRALGYADRAIALDSSLAQAHAARGLVLRFWREPNEGVREIRHAIELEPSYAWAHLIYVRVVSAMGRQQDALSEAELAVALDPHDPGAHRVLGTAFAFAVQYERAIEELEQSIELAPTNPVAHVWLVLTDVFAGEYEQAELAARRWMDVTDGNPSLFDPFFKAAAGELDLEQALPVIAATERVFGPFWAAQMHAILGDTERAVAALERSREMNDPNLLQYVRASPAMELLHEDVRYQAILEQIPY